MSNKAECGLLIDVMEAIKFLQSKKDCELACSVEVAIYVYLKNVTLKNFICGAGLSQ